MMCKDKHFLLSDLSSFPNSTTTNRHFSHSTNIRIVYISPLLDNAYPHYWILNKNIVFPYSWWFHVKSVLRFRGISSALGNHLFSEYEHSKFLLWFTRQACTGIPKFPTKSYTVARFFYNHVVTTRSVHLYDQCTSNSWRPQKFNWIASYLNRQSCHYWAWEWSSFWFRKYSILLLLTLIKPYLGRIEVLEVTSPNKLSIHAEIQILTVLFELKTVIVQVPSIHHNTQRPRDNSK